MSLTLVLMRHAKSSWDDPALADHDRPLNPRGQRAAVALGDWLRDQGHMPEEALISTSARTRETFARLGLDLAPRELGEMYHAGPMRLIECLRKAHERCVLMIGHNPGLAEFAANIVEEPPQHNRFFDYPTCATLVARFERETWHDLTWSEGRLVDFVVPRELQTPG